MLLGVHSVISVLESLVVSRLGAVIATAVITHLATIKLKVANAVREAEAKAVASIRAKYDEVAEAIRAEAEHDEVIVKATIAKIEADVRKIF